MTEASELKSRLRDIFRAQPLAVLAIQGDGYPYANLVAFLEQVTIVRK